MFLGGNGADTVDGNRGNDTAYLGNGRDSFRWDPGDGSDIVEGQNGTDTLDFNGAAANEIMSLSPNGTRSLFLRDVANIRMDMDDVERLDLTALGGVDTVTVDDMSGTDFRRADVDLSGPAGGGDAAADVVNVNGTAGADRIRVVTEAARVDVKGLRQGSGSPAARPSTSSRSTPSTATTPSGSTAPSSGSSRRSSTLVPARPDRSAIPVIGASPPSGPDHRGGPWVEVRGIEPRASTVRLLRSTN